MKLNLGTLAFLSLFSIPIGASAAVRYVNVNNSGPVAPYTSWATAATVIQDAIGVSTNGDTILVTNGVYRVGGEQINGSTTNRVAITNAVTVQSVNGPQVTIIEGQPAASGPTTRCAYVADGGALIGFTLTNGLARPVSSEPAYEEIMGGGVFCQSTNAVVARCILIGNSANESGGGAFSGTLVNCAFTGNTAGNHGGGASSALLKNCTLTANSAILGGGADSSALLNCISFFNSAQIREANYFNSTVNYSCTTPLPMGGTGNLAADPQMPDPIHINATSPCRGAGSAAYASGTDIDGEAWLNPPSMGCDEFHAGITGPLSVAIQAAYTNVTVGFAVNFTGQIAGHASANRWDFGDSTVVSNRLAVAHAWSGVGDFPVVFTAFNDTSPAGVSATVIVHVVSQPVYYVARSNSSPAAPYSSWATAATNLQDAVDVVTTAGALVLVTNGFYDLGGRDVAGVSNRVAAIHALNLQSVNGPAATVIDGGAAATCAYLAAGASLTGFTLTNGTTPSVGGGVMCEPGAVVVSNCVFTGNSASAGGGGGYGTFLNCSFVANNSYYGGAVYGGTLKDCVVNGNGNGLNGAGGVGLCILTNCSLATNSAFFGGAADSCIMADCSLTYNSAIGGGGASSSSLYHCLVMSNSAQWYNGGGVSSSDAHDCTFIGNTADYGGGTADSSLNNCTLTGNWAGSAGGAASGGTITNCTITGNMSYNLGGGTYSSTVVSSILSSNTANAGGGDFGSILINCKIFGNTAGDRGGGTFASTLNNCAVYCNSALDTGGGVFRSTLSNCTVTRNSVVNFGGGSGESTLHNCIVFFNSAAVQANCSLETADYSCTTPLPADGTGNIATDPQLTDVAHIAATSPARGTGSALYSGGVDLDGESWLNPPSMGCDEFNAGAPGALTVSATSDFTNCVQGFTVNFGGVVIGHATAHWWDFGDGTKVTNLMTLPHAWSAGGDYAVVLQAYNDDNPGGISATVMVHVVSQTVYYADAGGVNPVAPYASWATAATNLQDAADAGPPGATILATNGVYRFGGRLSYGSLTNRVSLAKPLTLRSVNGPALTWILGYQVSTNGFGDNAIRCAYLGNNALLSGFTLTNGGTRMNPPDESDANHDQSGAGAWCESSAVVSNCVFVGNAAFVNGGGVFGGAVFDSTFTSNRVAGHGGAAYSSIMNNCSITGNSAFGAGGAFGGSLSNCTLINNIATADYGGGAYSATLTDCTVSGNYASIGGGIASCGAIRCVLIGNFADYGGAAWNSTVIDSQVVSNSVGLYGGGVIYSMLVNCRVAFNSAYSGGAADSSGFDSCVVSNNTATLSGGAATSSALGNSILSGNSASFGGAVNNCDLNFCTLSNNSAVIFDLEGGQGGAAYSCTMRDCQVLANSAAHFGGGVAYSSLESCLIAGNVAVLSAGGVSQCNMNNCTVTGNSSPVAAGAQGGAGYNSILYYNSGDNYDAEAALLNYCCTTPLPTNGVINFTNAPGFVNPAAGNYRLLPASLCINSGHNAYALSHPDLDGNPRIAGNQVDVGAYEFQSPTSIISYLWLHQYGLPNDGSADYADTDGDQMENWQEALLTSPLDPDSRLQMLSVSYNAGAATVTWQSVSGVTYFLNRSSSLLDTPAFGTIATGLTGQTNSTSFIDGSTEGPGPYFYRIGVEQ